MLRILDTDTAIHLLREPSAEAVDRLRACPAHEIVTTSITAAELRYGALKSARPAQNLGRVELFLAPLRRLDFDDAAAARFARIKHDLTSTGNVIGVMDMLIAAIAQSSDAAVVTNNTRDFSRVAGLRLENWIG